MSERILGGRYRIEDVLGRGGMASVYKGTDTVLGRPVAIKILAALYAQDSGFVARFRREAQAAASLNHPNLVSVYDTGSDDGTHYIVMEYVEGRTLADFLTKGGRLMPERAIELTESVCDALEYAHANGVIHRDIKPGNIMVTRSGEVKVTDFGIARVTTGSETIEQTAAVLGTASYLSPEQAQGQPVDARSDLYSLGVVLFEMVTGRVPFTGDSAVSVAYKHVQEAPLPPSELNPDVTPALDAVIMRALAKNPANRYQSAGDFKRDLERARDGLPVEATPLLEAAETRVIGRTDGTQLLPPQPAPSGGGRRWMAWIAIGALVLAVLGGGGYFLAHSLLKNDNSTKPVKVPNVVGATQEEAVATLKGAHLKYAVETKVVHEETKVDTVIAQDPAAGALVPGGTTITITVGKAPKHVLVPNFVGLSADDARKAIVDAGLTPGQVLEQPSSEPVGQVIEQFPPPGASVEVGSTVDLKVSSGPGDVEVPRVLCLPVDLATQVLDKRGFIISVEGTRPTPSDVNCPPTLDLIVVQDPAAGSMAPSGSTVKVWTAEPEPSPSVSKSPGR